MAEAYIQTVDGNIPDDWIFSAMLGLRDKGFVIKHFERHHITDLPFNFETILVGYVETMVDYFKVNNVPVPQPLNIPESLMYPYFLGREINTMTMGEFKADEINCPIFVRPYNKTKAFSSGPCEHHSLKSFAFHKIPDDEMVMTSTIVDFISEYRCFVHNGKLKGIQWYQGDFCVFPDILKIHDMVEHYKDAPIAYTLDVGVVLLNPEGFTATYLVECNDMWAVGHYGLRDRIYSTLLRDRWFEIIRPTLIKKR